MHQIYISSAGCKSRNQGILEHVARKSRILSDDDMCLPIIMLLAIVVAKVSSNLIGMLHCKIYICLASESICSKIFTHCKILDSIIL